MPTRPGGLIFGTVLWILDGMAQGAGVGLIVIGTHRRSKILVRDDVRFVQSSVRPQVLIGPGSVALRVSF